MTVTSPPLADGVRAVLSRCYTPVPQRKRGAHSVVGYQHTAVSLALEEQLMSLTAVIERHETTVVEPAWAHGHRQPAQWHRICRLEDLEPFWGEAALLGGVQVALVRLPDDRLFAVDHYDPLAQAHVMARGIVGSKQGRPTLASPINKQVYDLATGKCLSDDSLALRCYPVRVLQGVIEVLA